MREAKKKNKIEIQVKEGINLKSYFMKIELCSNTNNFKLPLQHIRWKSHWINKLQSNWQQKTRKKKPEFLIELNAREREAASIKSLSLAFMCLVEHGIEYKRHTTATTTAKGKKQTNGIVLVEIFLRFLFVPCCIQLFFNVAFMLTHSLIFLLHFFSIFSLHFYSALRLFFSYSIYNREGMENKGGW